MRALRQLNWRLTAPPALATAGALALLWLVRAAPRAAGPVFAADALGAFFCLATFLGLALAAATQPRAAGPFPWRTAAAALVAAAAYLTALTPLLALAYLALAGLTLAPRRGSRLTPGELAGLLAAALLALGYGTLALRGALRYDERTAGAALDSLVFWFVLLAAGAQLLPLAPRAAPAAPFEGALRIAWLYPLARLYSLGPWNAGWSLAALLFGGGLALWAAGAALGRADAEGRGRLLATAQLAMALAGFGLSTGAGIAAGCYGLLAYGLLAAAGAEPSAEPDASLAPAAWLLTPAAPFAAPFVGAWMLLGAGVAGGVSLLGAAAWLAALLGAAACVIGGPWRLTRRALALLAGAALALGVLAPAIVLLLIQPVIEQLQGGLSVYGDVNIWPWVGLAAVDSSRRGVTALPSIAAAALMLVLTALVYLAARLRGELGAGAATDGPGAAPGPSALLERLRAEVPWLGAGPRGEERRGDGR